MIKVCEKCMRIKLNDNAPWSPRPSPQVSSMPKNKFETVEECDYCDGTIQEAPGKKHKETEEIEETERKEDTKGSEGNIEPNKEVGRNRQDDTTGSKENNESSGVLPKKRGRPKGSRKKVDDESKRAESGKDENPPSNEGNDGERSEGNGVEESGSPEAPESDDQGHKGVESENEEKEVIQGKIINNSEDQLATLANRHHQALVQCKKLMGQSMLEFCIHLREIKSKELFRFYANSWYEYLSMPEVGLDDTRARRLIRLINVKDAMEKQLDRPVNFDEISEARLTRDLLPCIQYDEDTGKIKNIKSAEELLDQARNLGHEDWQAEVEKKKPRVAGKKASEVLIEAPAPVMDNNGNPIGHLISVSANEENHYLRIRIANENISDGPLIIKVK
jgi:hypothetical protein